MTAVTMYLAISKNHLPISRFINVLFLERNIVLFLPVSRLCTVQSYVKLIKWQRKERKKLCGDGKKP